MFEDNVSLSDDDNDPVVVDGEDGAEQNDASGNGPSSNGPSAYCSASVHFRFEEHCCYWRAPVQRGSASCLPPKAPAARVGRAVHTRAERVAYPRVSRRPRTPCPPCPAIRFN